MNAENFCYYLKGFLTTHEGIITPEQKDEIKKMLDMSFPKIHIPLPTSINSRWTEETFPGPHIPPNT